MLYTSRVYWILFLLLAAIVCADQPPFYVKTDGNNDANGLSWETAFATIQKAIDSAADGQEIIVSSGTYYEQLDFKGKNLNVHGYTTGDLNAIIDAQKLGTAIIFRGNESDSCQLKGFTIRNGYPAEDELALYLKLDGSGTSNEVRDDSGKARNGILNNFNFDGSSGWLAGYNENALQYDGVDDFVAVCSYKGIAGKGARTCSAWIKSSYTSSTYQVIMSWGADQTGQAGQRWIFRLQPSGKLSVGIGGGYVEMTRDTNLNDGDWHHVAAVVPDISVPVIRDVLLYVDGHLETTTCPYDQNLGLDPNRQINTGNMLDVRLGCRLSIGITHIEYFNGQIDEARIYSRALGEGEIRELAENTGLVAHWKLDESSGTSASDSVGNINDGTLIGDLQWQPAGGRVGGALSFNGNDYVTLPAGIINPGNGSFSAFAWVRLEEKQSNNFQVILQQRDVDASHPGRVLLARDMDDRMFSALGLNAARTYSTGQIFTMVNQWRHVGITYDGQTVTLYADGVACGSSIQTAEDCDGLLYLGIHKGLDPVSCWDGLMDDVRIYDRVLSQDEICQLAGDVGLVAHWKLDETTGTSAPDVSGNNYLGILTNMNNEDWVDGMLGNALSFDGSDDYVRMIGYKGVGGGESRTCCAWIKTSSAPGVILAWGKNTVVDGSKWLMRVNNTGELRIEVANGYIYGTRKINDGNWHFVAAVLENDGSPNTSDIQLYVDGLRETSWICSPQVINTGGDQDVSIGVFLTEMSRWYQGLIDDVQIYNRAFTSSEIRALYQQRFAAGGGIRGHGTHAAITQCIIENNETSQSGGGIDSIKGDISRCYIINNTAGEDGGGLSDCNSVENSVIVGNVAQNVGAMDNCDGNIVNCTIADNAATLACGGIKDCNGVMINAIVWNNRDNTGVSQDAQVMDCNEITYSCIQNWSGGGIGNISDDPNFENTRMRNYHLDAGSVCINAGDTGNYENQIDLDGNPRSKGHNLRIDQGAYEFQQKIWYVKTDGSDTNDGQLWNTAFATIQNGIDHSISGDVVLVADGRYTGSDNRDIDFGGKAITVRSVNGPETCIIDCEGDSNNSQRGFNFYSGEGRDSIVEGFTIINGYKTFDGGAIRCLDSSPVIRNCRLISNTAGESGGAIFIKNSDALIYDCIFQDNKGGDGGGIFNKNSEPNIINCIFHANSAIGPGGSGGAIYNSDSKPRLINCTITLNDAYHGGGLKNMASYPSLINCIVWGNTGDGGVIQQKQIWDYTSSESYVYYSCIQDDNSSDSSIPYSAVNHNIDDNPCFSETNGVFYLQPVSPCIDTGNNSITVLPITDIAGLPRIVDGEQNGSANVDMGAYEYQVYHAPVAKDDPDVYGMPIVCTGGSVLINVLANDFDPDGDNLLIYSEPNSIMQPAHGTVAIVNDNMTVTYTPQVNFSGTDSFCYKASDGQSASNWATVTVAVQQTDVQHNPIANPDSIVVAMGTSVEIDVLDNDSDPDEGDTLSIQSIVSGSGPTKGKAEITQDGKIRYTPYQFNGFSDTFTYQIQDSTERTAQADVTVRIVGVDAGPGQTIRLPINSVFLDGSVYGAALNATIQWQVLDKPVGSNVLFGFPNSADTEAVFSLPGTYLLQVQVNSDGLIVKDTVVITVQANSIGGNQPPRVQAKAEPNEMELPDHTTLLSWIVSDDGVTKGSLSQQWEMVDGPIAGHASFGTYSPQSRQTSVSFSADGVYILKLTVSDGIDLAESLVMVKVNRDSSINQVPIVDAGPNRQVSLLTGPQSITLDSPQIKADDPDNSPQTLSFHWTVMNQSSGIVFISNADILNPTLMVSIAGQYILQLEASDGLATVRDTMLISTNSVKVDAGPDEVVVLPDDGQVTHKLSGTCQSEPAGLYSATEWEMEVQPEGSNIQFDPQYPATMVLDPNVTFEDPGDYVFKLIARDSQGQEVGSDEVYIKVKPASQVFTTYLYLYAPPTGSNLVFSSYEDGTKLAWQKVDPNGILSDMKDVNPSDPNDPNLLDISDANPMVKGQYVYINGQDSVYKVTSGNNKYSVLTGDVYGDNLGYDYDNTSGYFVMSKNGLGVDTEFYSHIHGFRNEGRRMVIFAYQDNTHVTVNYEFLEGGNGIVNGSDLNLDMEKYNPATQTYDNAKMDNYELSAGEHVSIVPFGYTYWAEIGGSLTEIWVVNPIYIHVISDNPVSVEMCNDSGLFVPSSDGFWVGKSFKTFIDAYLTWGGYFSSDMSITLYENGTEVSIWNDNINKELSLIWSGTLNAGENFLYPGQVFKDIDETVQGAYLSVESTKPVAMAVRPSPETSGYAHGEFAPDKGGTGAGVDLIGYCVKECTEPEFDEDGYNPDYYTRYFTILSHNDDTQFKIYDPETWEPRILISGPDDPNDPNDRTIFTLNEGQCFKAENYLTEDDHNWRVVSTKPVTVSTGANKAFAEYAPLAGIQSPMPKIEITAKTGKGYPDQADDPNVYIGIPDLDEITYTISYWNPSANPTVYGQKIIDELPDLVDRESVQFTGPKGSYDKETNTIIWDIGMITSGQGETDPCQVTVTVRVNQYPKNCNKVVNRARIENVDSYRATLPVFVQVDTLRLPEINSIIYVDAFAPGLNNGSSWKDAFNDLQKALQIAPSSGASQIWVASGVYSPGPLSSSTFLIHDGVSLYGGFCGTETNLIERDLTNNENRTVLTGLNGNYDVVTMANSIIDGFTIQDGMEAGIYCDKGSPKIRNCYIFDNIGYNYDTGYWYGCGIYCGTMYYPEAPSPVIMNNIISENIEGIYLNNTRNISIQNNIIVNNNKGINISDNLFGLNNVVRNNTIVNNKEYAIFSGYGKPSIVNCIIWGSDDFYCGKTYGSDLLMNIDAKLMYKCCLPEPNFVDWSIIDPNFVEANSTSHSIFENCYLYSDKTVAVSDVNYICVEDATRFRLNEKIEIEDDGVLRTITRIIHNDNYEVMEFEPVRLRSIDFDTSVYKWGADATSADEDYHIKPCSRCVDKGYSWDIGSDEVDIDGQPRKMGGDPNGLLRVDIGADECAAVYAGRYPVQVLQNSNTIDLTFSNALDYLGAYRYEWSYESGPANVSYVNSSSADLQPTIRFSVPGIYQFKLEGYTADNHSLGYDITNITVYLGINAGPDRDVFLNNGYWDETLTGDIIGGSADHVYWSQVSGPDEIAISSPEAIQATAAFTKQGYYQFRLSAYDSSNTLIGSDDVVVTVHSSDLFVEAGSDQDAQLTLSGTVAVILDEAWYTTSALGTSVTDYWEVTNTNKPFTFTKNAQNKYVTTFSATGLYVLAYTVSENGGQTVTDTMTVRVYPGNVSVSVYAGTDLHGMIANGQAQVTPNQAFVYPTENVSLQWYDDNDNPISGANAINSTFTFTQAGTYTYTLKATRDGVTISDSVNITIYPESTDGFYMQTGNYGPVLAGEAFPLSDAIVCYNGPGTLSYTWTSDDPDHVTFGNSPDEGLTSTILRPSVQFAEGLEKTYKLILTVEVTQNSVTTTHQAEVYIQAVTELTPQTDTQSPNLTMAATWLDENGDASNIPVSNNTFENGSIWLEIYALDSGSGLSTITVKDNGTAISGASWNFSATNPAYPTQLQVPYQLEIMNLETGPHTITVTAIDKTGNIPTTQTVAFTVSRPGPNETSKPYAIISNLEPGIRDYGQMGTLEEPNEVITGLYPVKGIAYHPLTGQEVQFKFELFDTAAMVYSNLGSWELLDGKHSPNPDYLVQRLSVYDASACDEGYYKGVSASGMIGSVTEAGTIPSGFGNLDLTGVSNGTYALLLTVRSRPNPQTDFNYSYAVKQFVLNCPLKIGNVKFSQEDTVITVGGVPLRIVRTYDSFQKDKNGDFGYGWSYSIANMDIQLEEDRVDMAVWEDDWGSTWPDTESIRVSPNYDRNVTLTLPDGNRTTFQFYLEYHDVDYDDAQMSYYVARYQSPEGITAKLETLDEERLNILNVWEGQTTATHYSGTNEGAFSDPDYYEFSGYRLTTEDGTQYIFNREPKDGNLFGNDAAWITPLGQPYLASIRTSTGETINMNVNPATLQIGQQVDTENHPLGIQHQIGQEVTKAIKIDYDPTGRITAIWAPMEQAGTVPTVRYDYDTAGNLWKVHKLVDKIKAAGSDPNLGYEVLTYEYDNTQFDPADHYITAIKDPRGLAPIQYLYDDAGRLVGTKDAKGNTIAINHDINSRQEIVTDRAGNPTIYEYDDRGNVLSITDTQGNITSYTYDSNNPLKISNVKTTTTQVPDYDNPGETLDAITTYDYVYYDTPGQPGYGKLATQTVTDPLLNRTQTWYDTSGNVTSITQNKWDADEEEFVEVLTTQTKYTTNNLPYLTGTTTGATGSLVWHSLSLTCYDEQNRVERSVQIDMENDTVLDWIFVSQAAGTVESHATLRAITTWPGCSVTSYVYNSSLSNSPDQVYSVTGPDSQTQHFAYDQNNQQVQSWTNWIDPQNANHMVQILSQNISDDAGRIVQTQQVKIEYSRANSEAPWSATTSVTLPLSRTEYNSIGKVWYSIDQQNNLTKYDYDQTGNTVCTTTYNIGSSIAWDNTTAIQTHIANADNILTESRTLYDAEGRAVVSVGPYDPAVADKDRVGTETVYDTLGRVERTRTWANVAITLQDIIGTGGAVVGKEATGCTSNGVAMVAGNELSYSRTEYDSAGRVAHSIVTDENRYERVTSYLYDLAGRQTTVIDHLGHDITYTPQTIGGIVWNIATTISLKTDESHRTDTYYDGNRRDYVEDAAGNITRFMYDAAGQIIRTTYPNSIIDGAGGNPVPTYSHIKYDGIGRKAWESAQTCQIDPDHVDLTTESNNDKLRRKYFGYDIGGKLTSVTMPVVQDPENNNTWTAPVYQYVYDDCGNQIGILDPKNHLTVFKFDCLNRQTKKYQPFTYSGDLTPEAIYTAVAAQSGLKFEETTYDSFGRVEMMTDCKGQLTVYTYDTRGRLSYERHYANAAAYISATPTYNANPEIHTTYDNLGRKVTVAMRSYDNTGQLISGSEKQWGYSYDNEGRVELSVSPQGNIWYVYSPVTSRMTSMRILQPDLVTVVSQTDYSYDELGRLKTVSVKKRNGVTVDETTTYGYNEVGSLKSIEYPSDVYAEYTYNALNRLTNLTNYATSAKSGVLSSFTYSLSANGQRTQAIEQGVSLAGETLQYGYDNLNRLIWEIYPNSGGCVAEYVYDLAGNRKQWNYFESEQLYLQHGTLVNYLHYSYNEKDQLITEDFDGSITTYQYDDNGSVFRKYHGANTATDPYDAYSYDLQSRLIGFIPNGGSAVAYTYNPEGIRTGKSVGGITTAYLIDSMNPTGYAQILQSDDGTNKTFYAIGSDVIGQVTNTANPTYLLYDGHSSTRQNTNNVGSVTNGYTYDGYGNDAIGNVTSDGLYYTGEMYDKDLASDGLGQYYLRSRYYDPWTGRFNAMDSYAGNTYDPQSLHKYLYCNGNPINGIDPSGKFTLLMDFLSAFNLGEQLKAIKDNPNIVIKKGAEEVKEEIKDAFDWSDPMPIPVVAQNAEILWVARLRMLGLNAIPMQSSAVGQHGPDILAFGYVGGKYTVLVGEVKGMKRSRVLSSLDRLSNGIMQMSARWIDKYTSLMANTISEAVVEAGAGLLPPGTGEVIQNILKDQSQFELYLLRARYYRGEEWRLKGFRLMRIGKENVGIGASLDRNLEQELILKTPAGLIP